MSMIHPARWLALGLCLFLMTDLASAVDTLTEIKIESRGVKIQNPDFVMAYVSLKPGDLVEQRKISRDVKTLLDSGHFTFVDSQLERGTNANGFVLTYIVELKPKLEKEVSVVGAEEVGARKVRNWLELEIGEEVSDAVLSRQVRKVLEEYHKRYYHDVKVTWTIDADAATGFANVTLTVHEGDRASLRKVEFEGNTYQEPSAWEKLKAGVKHQKATSPTSVQPEELEEAMQPRLWHIWSFITKRGVYNPDDLDADRVLLREKYQNRGYLDAKIEGPQVNAYAERKLAATYMITEGAQYRIGTVTLRGITIFPETNLLALVKLKTGDIAAMDAITRTASTLRDYYLSRGYMRANVKPLLSPRTGGVPTVDIQFDFFESSQVNIRYVDIRGNTRTKDKVIRRELLIYPDELYDQVRIKRSENIVKNLGFFSNVSSYPRETLDPKRDDLVFEVEEQRTGQFMVGAGYSSVDEVIGFIELSQGNFDIFNWPYFTGDGQKLRLRTQFGTVSEDYSISFVEPWFLDRKLSLGVDLYDSKRSNLSQYYSEQRIGGAVTLGKPIPNFFFQRANLRYGLEQIDIYDIATNAIQRIKDEEGERMVSSMKLTFIHDTRDNPFIPSRGNKTEISGRLSGGPLGFDTDVYGFNAESTTYVPLWFDHVLSLRGWGEVVEEYGNNTDVHIFDRLFLGGARTLRGFKYRYVSPYEEGQPIGGKSGAMATAEYTIPITKKILRFATFYDIGNVWLDAYDFDLENYCSDIGIGVRLDIPGFPIRLDYAWPLEINGDVSRTSARFNFWMGYGF